MLFLVTGASGSGKSEYAEQLACNLAKRDGLQKKIYVATMERIGEEAERRITRHRKLRAGKGSLRRRRLSGFQVSNRTFLA